MKTRWLRKWPFAWLALWLLAAGLATLLVRAPEPALSLGLHPPGRGHWLGYDPLGRDLRWVVLQGSLISIGFAGASVLISTAASLVLGTAIALLPPTAGFLALRLLDTFLAFPSLLLALAWAAIRGPGWDTLFVSLLIGLLPSFTRLLYARSREIIVEPYIDASRSLGASPARILFRHLVPGLGSTCAVKIPVLFAEALMAEAILSFLGVGAPIGKETWGALLATGKDYLFEAPHIAIAAGIPLTLTVLALQLIGLELAGSPAASLKNPG